MMKTIDGARHASTHTLGMMQPSKLSDDLRLGFDKIGEPFTRNPDASLGNIFSSFGTWMTHSITGADLVRAANRIQHLSRPEIREHLHQSVVTIRDMRRAVGIPGSGTERDAIGDLLGVAERADILSEEEIQVSLLEAAEMIRTLRIVAYSGISLRLLARDLQAEGES